VSKFCAYGFFKNLQLFEAFLWAVLLSWGYTLVEIGCLGGIIEGLTYVFEVPSGILADTFGKKRELLICFVFYIISFILYSLAGPGNFGLLVAASCCYGTGTSLCLFACVPVL
jgi:MFS family permease